MSQDADGLRRRVVDSGWLRATYDAGEMEYLGAEAWADALTYAGLRPLLALSDEEIADAKLARALERVRRAGRQLEAAERGVGAVRGFLPGLKDSDWTVLAMALVGALATMFPGTTHALGLAMFGCIVLLMLVRVLGVRVRAPVGSETMARAEMTTAVLALIDGTWVSRAGDAIFENVPQAERLRMVVSRLDHTVDRARVRVDQLQRLEVELQTVNQSLGRTEADPELLALRQRRERLDEEIARVESLRTDFRTRLLESEGSLERLRLLARRRAVHQQIQQLSPTTELLTRTRAEAEVDLSGFDALVGELTREVTDVEQMLAASVEVAGL